jgi:hypothetical protein
MRALYYFWNFLTKRHHYEHPLDDDKELYGSH